MLSIVQRVENQFQSAILSLIDPSKGKPHIICAYSGGPDSTFLLILLKKFLYLNQYTLSAIYIDHGIRNKNEMGKELEIVLNLSEKLDLDLNIYHFSYGFLEFYAKKKGIGIEAAARVYRYHYFEKCRKKLKNLESFVALGHNQNDQIETILMRLFKGANFQGLKGISKKNLYKIRPLLDISRRDIESYLRIKTIPYWTDSTNLEVDYERNKIRHQLIPLLQEIFPKPEASILSLQNQIVNTLASEESFFYSEMLWERRGDGYTLSVESFEKVPRDFFIRSLLQKMNVLMKGILPADLRVPQSFFKPLYSKNLLSKKVFLKGYGIELLQERGYLILRKESISYSTFAIFYPEELLSFPFFTIKVTSQLNQEDKGLAPLIPSANYYRFRSIHPHDRSLYSLKKGFKGYLLFGEKDFIGAVDIKGRFSQGKELYKKNRVYNRIIITLK